MNLGGVSMYRYNDTVTAVIYILIQIKIIQQILSNLYLWQLKEYRLDRLKEHINRVYPNKFSALLGLTLFSPLKLPQKSVKAVLIFILNSGLNYVLFLPKNIFLAFSVLIITPFIFLFSLILTYPFEKIARLIIYHFASRKIANLQKNFDLSVIGITGSYGKSTTKSFIDQILSLKFNTLATPKSVNTPLGISLLILRNLNKNHQFFIVEMGAYNIGEIKELCQIVHPQIGVITGISNQHLALFGTQENIIKAKSELIEALPKEGIAIINKQSKWQPILKELNTKKIYFYPYYLNNDRDEMVKIAVPNFLKINTEPAMILARLYHIDKKKIRESLLKLQLPPKTMQRIKGFRGATIIDDSYNANLEGTLASLDYLQEIKAKKKIVVMPCLIELGQDSEKIHQEIGKKLVQTSDLAIITSDDYFAAIKKGAGESQKILCLPRPKKVIDFLSPIVNEKSIILIEGKVHLSIVKFLIQP